MFKWLKKRRDQDPRITELLAKMDDMEYALFTHRNAIRDNTRDIILLQKQTDVLNGKQVITDGKITAMMNDRGAVTIKGLYDQPSFVKSHLDNLMKG